MKRTTIMLPPGLKAQAERRARESGISLGQFIRQSIGRQVATDEKSGHGRDPLFAFDDAFADASPTNLGTRSSTCATDLIVEDYERTQREARKAKAAARPKKRSTAGRRERVLS